MPARAAPHLPTVAMGCAVAGMVLLMAAGAGAQTPPAGDPSARPGLFDRLFDQRDYLRQSAPIRRGVERAERQAAEAAERAAEARRDGALPPSAPPPRLLPAPSAADNARGAGSAARERARQRLMQDRLQRFLGRAARADRAQLDADTAAARAARAGTVARGVDRLQSGAAAGRSALGEIPVPGPRPLVRMPRVEPNAR